MLKACAKAVQIVGKACWRTVGVRPQSLWVRHQDRANSADKPVFMPVLSDVFAHRNPQTNNPLLYLFRQGFSPLSTQPITTTTNLKTKKGNN